MPREFQDFSQEVSQGTDKIKNSLDAVRNAADQADASSGRLSSTQDAGTRVADSYSRTMAGLSKELSKTASGSMEAARGISVAESSIRSLGASLGIIRGSAADASVGLSGLRDVTEQVGKVMEDLSGRKIGIEFDATSAMKARDSIEGVGEASEKSAKKSKKATETETKAYELIDKEIKLNQKLVDNLSKTKRKLTADEKKAASAAKFQIERLKEYKSALKGGEFKDAVKTTLLQEAVNYTVADSFHTAMKESKDFKEEIENLQKAMTERGAFSRMTSDIKEMQSQLKALEGSSKNLSGLEKAKFIDLSVGIAQIRELNDLMESGELDEYQQNLLAAEIEAGNFAEAIKMATKYDQNFAASLHMVSAEAHETATASKTYTGEVDKAKSVMDLLNNKFQEGKREAKSFAGGIGVTNGRLIGAGVAVAFVTMKAAEMIDKFKDSRLELGRFNIELAALESQSGALGLDRGFKAISDELNLTREQSSKFFEVYKQGAQTGVVSSERLAEAASDIQKAFGGDPTEKLREFVELLRSIPTLETDLSITASLDDQASALFGLATEGKMSVLAEFQAAGIVGGKGAAALSETDVEILNAQQKTEKTMEDIHDVLLNKFFPTIGPQLSALVGGTTKVVAALGGVVAGLGVISSLTGAQITAQHMTTAAVLKEGAMDDVGSGLKLLTKETKSLVSKIGTGAGRAAGSVATGVGTGVGTGAAGLGVGGGAAAGGAAVAAAPVIIAAAVAALGAAAIYGGAKLQDMGDEAEMSGKRLDAGIKQTTGSLLQIQGAALLLGPAGAIGTLAFNMEELGSGLENLGSAAMTNAADMGDFGPAVFAAGNLMDDFGVTLQAAESALWDYINSAKKSITDGFNKLPGLLMGAYQSVSEALDKGTSMFLSGLNALGVDVDKVKDGMGKFARFVIPGAKTFLSLKEAADAYIDESNKLFARQKELNKAFSELQKRSQENAKAFEEDRMRIVRAGLALERQLNAINSEFDSSALKLSELGVAVSSVRLDQLSEFGGTAANFDRAVSESADAVMKKFGELAEAGARSRVRILKDSGLDSKTRKAALMELNKRELEATEEFVKGMGKVIDALFQTPQILIAGFERELAGAEIDIEIARGGGAAGIGAIIERETDAAIEALEKTRSAREKANGEIAKLEQIRIKQVEAFKTEFINQLKEMGKEADDVTKEVSDALKKRLIDEGVVKETDKGFEVDTDKASQSISKTRENLEKAESEIERLRKSLNPESFASLATELRQYSNEQKASEAATKEALEARRGATTDEERIEAAKKEAKAKAQAEEAQKKSVEISKKLVGLIETNATLTGKEEQVQKAVAIAAEAFAMGQVPSVKALERANIDADVAQEVMNQLGRTLDSSNEETAANLRKEIAKAQLESQYLSIQEGLTESSDASAKEKEKQADAAKKVAEAEQRVREIVLEGIQKQLDIVSKTDDFIKAQRTVDFSETLAEVATFSDDYVSILESGTKMAVAAAKERGMLEKQAIEQGFEEAKKAIEANLASGDISKDKANVQLESANLERRSQLAKAELKEKNAVLDAAKREADLKLEAIGLEEELINAEADFLSEIGGSFDSILKLQQAGVALEYQKLEVLQKQYDDAVVAGTSGIKLRQIEVALEKQKFAYNKKQFGVQKDIFEKLLGKAFGEMQDISGTKGRGSDVGLLGTERTRVMGRGGLYLRTEAGNPGSLAQRAAGRAIEAAFGKLGGEVPAGQDLASEEAKRTEIEKRIQEETAKNRQATESIDDNSKRKGSLYTHDTTTESLLQNILDVLKRQLGFLETTKGAITQTTGQPTDMIGPAAGMVESAAKEMKGVVEKTQAGVIPSEIEQNPEVVKAVRLLRRIESGRNDMAKITAENRNKVSDDSKKKGLRESYQNALTQFNELPTLVKDNAKFILAQQKAVEKSGGEVKDAVIDAGKKTEVIATKTMKQAEAQTKIAEKQKPVGTELKASDNAAAEAIADKEESAADKFEKSIAADNAIRKREMMNPLAGAKTSPEIRRALSGRMSDEQKEYLKKQTEAAKGTQEATQTTAMQAQKTQATNEQLTEAQARAFGSTGRGALGPTWERDEKGKVKFKAVDWKAAQGEIMRARIKGMQEEYAAEKKEKEDLQAKTDVKEGVVRGVYRDEEGKAVKEMDTKYGMISSTGPAVEAELRKIEAQNALAKNSMTGTEVIDAGEKNKPAVKTLSDREGREEQLRNQRASNETIAGMGSGTQALQSPVATAATATECGEFKVGGMISIKLDSKMFKAEVEKVMAEKILGPQVRNQLDKEYLGQNV